MGSSDGCGSSPKDWFKTRAEGTGVMVHWVKLKPASLVSHMNELLLSLSCSASTLLAHGKWSSSALTSTCNPDSKSLFRISILEKRRYSYCVFIHSINIRTGVWHDSLDTIGDTRVPHWSDWVQLSAPPEIPASWRCVPERHEGMTPVCGSLTPLCKICREFQTAGFRLARLLQTFWKMDERFFFFLFAPLPFFIFLTFQINE